MLVKIMSRVLLVIAVMLPLGVLAEPAQKVVVLDLLRAIMMTDVAREKLKALEGQKEYVEIQKKAESLGQQLSKKEEEFQKEGPAWSAEKRNSFLQDMEFSRKDLGLARQKLQTEQQELMRGVVKDMEPKAKQILEQLLKEQQIALVIERNAAIYVADPSVDITGQLTERLNKAK